MLVHHSGQEYNVAATEAAQGARAKFEAQIERGRKRALAVVEQVETNVPVDRVVRGSKLKFFAKDKAILVGFPDGEGTEEGFHRHAIGQAATRAEMPLGFVDKMLDKGDWGAELIADNFNRIYSHGGNAKFLTRSVQGEVRGFLSDSYRRLDTRPIMEQFFEAVSAFGALPVDGFALETKIALKAVLPAQNRRKRNPSRNQSRR